MGAALDSNDYEKSQQVAKEFYDVAQKGHSDLFRAHAAANYAQLLMVMGKPDEGKEILDEVMKLSASFAEDTVMGDIYNGYGLYEMVNGRNQYAAIEYNLKALEYTRNCNDKSGLVSVLSNLGLAMSAVGDTMGLRYALEAYQLAKETGRKNDMMHAAVRMMEQMKTRGNISEAKKWMDIYIKSAPPSRMATVNEFLSYISMMEKDYAKANYYIDLAIAEADTSKNMQPISKIGFYYTKAFGLYEEGRCKESLQWLDKSMNLAKELGDMSKEMESVMLYCLNYKKLGNYREALKFLDQWVKNSDEQNKLNRINILKAKEVALDVAQKDAKIELQHEHNRMMRRIMFGVLVFCLMLMLICFYIYKMYKRQYNLRKIVVERAKAREAKEEERQRQIDDHHAELFQRMKQVIEEEQLFKDLNLSRESLAERLNTNRTYISETVKLMTGMSFPQYISNLRINEAERMLNDMNADVSNFTDLGKSLGFSSLSAFQTAFKRQTGMTLSTYRKIAQEKGESGAVGERKII